MKAFLLFLYLMGVLFQGPQLVKAKDCVSGFAAYAAGPVIDAAPAMPLTFFTFDESPSCKNFELSLDQTTVRNKKLSFIKLDAVLQVENLGPNTGNIIATPVFSEAQTETPSKQTVPGLSCALIALPGVVRVEEDETAQLHVQAVGSSFLVGGGITGVQFMKLDQKVPHLQTKSTNSTHRFFTNQRQLDNHMVELKRKWHFKH